MDNKSWFDRALWLRDSQNATEQESIQLGLVECDQSPYLLPRKSLDGHLYARGSPGSNKTAMLAMLIEQLGSFGDCSMHIHDIKGDCVELFEAGKAVQEWLKKRKGMDILLKWFTDRVGDSTFGFNVFLQPGWQQLTPLQKTSVLCSALNLQHGTDYGASWFSHANAAVLSHVFKRYPNVRSFRELAEILGHVIVNAKRQDLHSEVRNAGLDVKLVVDQLAGIDALNVTDKFSLARQIDLASSFAKPQIVYWSLPGDLEPYAATCRLAVSAQLQLARLMKERPCRTYCILDEFQQVIARNLKWILQGARSIGMSLLLANQCLSDLTTPGTDLRPTVLSCTRVQWGFNLSDPEEQELLARTSGHRVELFETQGVSVGAGGTTTSRSYSEQLVPFLSLNEIKALSADLDLSFVILNQDEGFARYRGFPQILRTRYHITEEAFNRRRLAPWPAKKWGMLTPKLPEPLPPPDEDGANGVVSGGETIPRPTARPRKPSAPGRRE